MSNALFTQKAKLTLSKITVYNGIEQHYLIIHVSNQTCTDLTQVCTINTDEFSQKSKYASGAEV